MLHSSPLTFSYPDGPSFSFPEVRAGAGEELLLLGSSGTGKTTLLHLLAGLRSAQSGRIEVAGRDMVPLSDAQRDRHRGEHVGIVFQTAHFLDALSVMDNLCMPQYLNGDAPDRNRAQEMLERLQLGHKAGSRPRNLSVGEQQRVAIARALMHRPKLVFADEPTSALDDANATQVMNLLREQTADVGATLVVVTHDQRLKDRIANTVAL